MARARNIKPGFYKNEDLAECSVWARFVFPGLWMLADREGRLEDRPKRIKAELLPFDTQDMEPLLRELSEKRDGEGVPFIVRYEIDGVRYIQISKFLKHQTPHYSEKPSVIKPPPLRESSSCKKPRNSEKRTSIKEGSQPPDSLNPDSLVPNPDSPNPDSLIPDPRAKQERGAARAGKRSPTRPMPDGFEISQRVRDWAVSKGHTRLEEHFEAFVSKARAKGYAYSDWDEGLMGAVRDDWARLRDPRAHTDNAAAIAEAERRLFGQTEERDITDEASRV